MNNSTDQGFKSPNVSITLFDGRSQVLQPVTLHIIQPKVLSLLQIARDSFGSGVFPEAIEGQISKTSTDHCDVGHRKFWAQAAFVQLEIPVQRLLGFYTEKDCEITMLTL